MGSPRDVCLVTSLFNHNCVAAHDLAVWCQSNNLSLNVSKTKELIVDYKKQRAEHAPIHIDGAVVQLVKSFKFLGVHVTKELSWSTHTNTIVTGNEKIWHGPSHPQNVICS